MDERQQSQVARVITHELDLARRRTASATGAIYASHSAKGILGSGATVKAVSRALGEGADTLLNVLLEKVGQITRTTDAFEAVSDALQQHFAAMEPEVVKSATMASRRVGGDPAPSIVQAAMTLFDQIKADINARIDIERFGFALPKESEVHTIPAMSSTAVVAKNKGGKPLAAHWDAMWSHIAVQLWTGDLNPKSQADIKRAMFDWFNANSIDVGDTGVTDRARQLWLAIEVAR